MFSRIRRYQLSRLVAIQERFIVDLLIIPSIEQTTVQFSDVIVKKRLSLYLTACGLLLAGVSVSVPGLAQTKALAMLDGLSKGEWTVRVRDGSQPRKICVRTGEELIQLLHDEQNCSRFVVEDSAQSVTVQYTCRGNGYGRTSIRRETSGLVQVDSQGISDGQPFDVSAEARLTGTCG